MAAEPVGESERESPGPRFFFLKYPPGDNLNGMEKPPFQFGLKAVFLATTGVAILMAAGEAGRIFLGFVALWSMAAVILVAALAIFVLVREVIIDVVRFVRWTLIQFQFRSGSRRPDA